MESKQGGEFSAAASLRSSSNIDAISAAITASGISGMVVLKDKKANAGKFGYTYASLAVIMADIKKPLMTSGLAVLQSSASTDRGVVVTTRILHSSGQWIESDCEVPAKGSTTQDIGGAITYGRRYGLSALLGIVADDDTDAQQPRQQGSDGGKVARPAPAAPVNNHDPAAAAKAAFAKAKTHDELNRIGKSLKGKIPDSARGEVKKAYAAAAERIENEAMAKAEQEAKAWADEDIPHDPATGEVVDAQDDLFDASRLDGAA